MKDKQCALPIHAMQMVGRNMRRYGMLSVTVVLSFSLLLGYLCFTDSLQYNRYKALFRQPSNVVATRTTRNKQRLFALTRMVQQIDPSARHDSYYRYVTWLPQFENVGVSIYFLPEGRGTVCVPQQVFQEQDQFAWSCAEELEVILGRDTMALSGNEAIINETLYGALGTEEDFPFDLTVPYTRDGKTFVTMLSVVGVCSDTAYDGAGDGAFNGSIYTTQEVQRMYDSQLFDDIEEIIWFCSDAPKEIAACMEQLGLIPAAACLEQEQAYADMQTQNTHRFYTLLLLLLILAVNLYSSFTNALSERQYEIGVKQALGASPWHIMVQFLLESLALMMGNIAASIVVVSHILIFYKCIQRLLMGNTWTVHLSRYSAAMFAVCCFGLTVLYSVWFAWKSSRVEIIRHLKME